MLRRVQHKLRMIRYYSASRAQSAWTRALDLSLIASFLLALPAAWLCDRTVSRTETAVLLHGRLSCAASGGYSAWLDGGDRPRHTAGLVCGSFQFQVLQERRGWPITTTTERQPPTVDVDIVTEPRPRKNIQLAGDDPLRLAIEAALRNGQESQAVEQWRNSGASVHRHGWAWLAAAGAWWIILAFASSSAIQAAQFVALLTTRRKMRRRLHFAAEGKCAHCGYDLTGNEFAERCPECGQLTS